MRNPLEPQSDSATVAAFTARKWRQRNATTTSQYQRLADGAPGTRHYGYPANSQPAHARLAPLTRGDEVDMTTDRAPNVQRDLTPNSPPARFFVAGKGDDDSMSQPQRHSQR